MIPDPFPLIAAPPTPFADDGSLNLQAVEPLAELLAGNGVAGAFVAGTTGEGVSMTLPERRDLLARWAEVAGDRLEVIAHVGANCLAEARELAAHAAACGAAGIGYMPPNYFKAATLAGLADCCAQVASSAADLPFYYYHIPHMTGVELNLHELLPLLAERIDRFGGAKFTHSDLADFALCLAEGGGNLRMLFGRDEMLLAGLAAGAVGAVGTSYTFAAPLYARLLRAVRQGDMAAARAQQARAATLLKTLREFGGLVAVKSAVRLAGVDCGPNRLPLATLSPAEEDRFGQRLEDRGLLEGFSRL